MKTIYFLHVYAFVVARKQQQSSRLLTHITKAGFRLSFDDDESFKAFIVWL